MTPNEYRKKHRRCATCEYFKDNYYVYKRSCTAKGIITGVNKGRHCRVYKPKEFVK